MQKKISSFWKRYDSVRVEWKIPKTKKLTLFGVDGNKCGKFCFATVEFLIIFYKF